MSLPEFLARIAARTDAMRQWALENPEVSEAWDAAWEEDTQRDRVRVWEGARALALRDSGFPSRCVDDCLSVRHGQLGDTAAIKAARAFIASRKTFLVLGGGVGSTKSTGATFAAFESGRRARFVRSSELASFSQFDDEWRTMLLSPFLVVDDIGADKPSDWWSSRFGELVDMRYGNRLLTVLTANASPDALIDSLGARIASRIRSDSVLAATGGRDLRAGGAE